MLSPLPLVDYMLRQRVYGAGEVPPRIPRGLAPLHHAEENQRGAAQRGAGADEALARAGSKVLQGLERRREAEAALYELWWY